MADDVDDVDGTDDVDGAARQGRDDGQQPGPLWRQGVRAAAVALGIVLIVQGLLGMVLGDGADGEAGGAQQSVEASASFFDGIGGWPLAAAAVAFVLFARPWRLLGRPG